MSSAGSSHGICTTDQEEKGRMGQRNWQGHDVPDQLQSMSLPTLLKLPKPWVFTKRLRYGFLGNGLTEEKPSEEACVEGWGWRQEMDLGKGDLGKVSSRPGLAGRSAGLLHLYIYTVYVYCICICILYMYTVCRTNALPVQPHSLPTLPPFISSMGGIHLLWEGYRRCDVFV